MKRIIFTLVMALSATAMWAQSGVILSYTEGGVQKEQAFRLDSVSSWGYNPSDKTVFVQPLAGAKFSVPSQNFLSFIYSPIVPDNAGISDYLVVHVDGQKAAFLLDDSFEMTWKDGVLVIKNSKQYQNIGLKNGIYFTVESLSFGYTNPNISSAPATGNWYLVFDRISDVESYDGNYRFIYFSHNKNIFIVDDDEIGFGTGLSALKPNNDGLCWNLYTSNKVIGRLAPWW